MIAATAYFGAQGRIGQKPFAIAIGVLLAIELGSGFLLAGLPYVPVLLVLLIFYPRVCVITKRLHDISRSGWLQLAPMMLAGMCNAGAKAFSPAHGGHNLPLAQAFWGMGLMVWLGFYGWLAMQKSPPYKNEFGPPASNRAPGASAAVFD